MYSATSAAMLLYFTCTDATVYVICVSVDWLTKLFYYEVQNIITMYSLAYIARPIDDFLRIPTCKV